MVLMVVVVLSVMAMVELQPVSVGGIGRDRGMRRVWTPRRKDSVVPIVCLAGYGGVFAGRSSGRYCVACAGMGIACVGERRSAR